MHKKILYLILIISLVFIPTFNVFAEENISVLTNREEVIFDVQPTIIDGRTLVPVRAIFENLGLSVEWIAETETVIGTKDTQKIELQINNKIAKVNGDELELDVPAQILDSRTLVPIRFVAESLNAEVYWNSVKKKIDIITNNQKYANYYGELKDNITKEGFGRMMYTYNNTYKGEWKNNSYHGYGQRVFYDETYNGYWSYGKRNGYGELTLGNGNIYKGEWTDNILFLNDNKYESIHITGTLTNLYIKMSNSDYDFYWKAAKKYVKLHLKSPSSAEFPEKNNNMVIIQRIEKYNNSKFDKEHIFIQGYVDAANAFGTLIREYFYITLDPYTYELKEITFNE